MKEPKKKSHAKIQTEKAEQREFDELVEDIKAFGVGVELDGEPEQPVAELEPAPALPESANINLVFARLFGGGK